MFNVGMPYGQRLSPEYPQPQAIHTLQPQALCFFVKDAREMDRSPVNPGVVCVGINSQDDEIYVRQMGNSGLVDVKKYKLAEQEAPAVAPEIKSLMDRIDAIDAKLSKLIPQQEGV